MLIVFSDINISQGSVMTVFFIANFTLSVGLYFRERFLEIYYYLAKL